MSNWNYGTRTVRKPSGLLCGPYYYLFIRPSVVEAGKRRKGNVRQIHIPAHLSSELTNNIMDVVVERIDDQEITRDGAIGVVEQTLQGWTKKEIPVVETAVDQDDTCSTCSCGGSCKTTQITLDISKEILEA